MGEAVVFVVDDDESIREALGSLIQSIGLRVEAFSSAREFLRHRGLDDVQAYASCSTCACPD